MAWTCSFIAPKSNAATTTRLLRAVGIFGRSGGNGVAARVAVDVSTLAGGGGAGTRAAPPGVGSLLAGEPSGVGGCSACAKTVVLGSIITLIMFSDTPAF